MIIPMKIFAAAAATLFVALSAHADLPSILRRADATVKMPKGGKFEKENVETTLRRSLLLLTPEEKSELGIRPESIAFANFRHGGKFYIAAIKGLTVDEQNQPRSAHGIVASTTYIREHWSAVDRPETKELEAHVLMNFHFVQNEGVQLVHEQKALADLVKKSGAMAKVPAPLQLPLIADLVYSIEAARPQSKYDMDFMPGALMFDFALAHLVYSLDERVRMNSHDTTKLYSKYPLDLSGVRSIVPQLPHPGDALLYKALVRSEIYGRNQTYNAALANCTNGLFDLIDEAVVPLTKPNYAALSKRIVEFANRDVKLLAQYAIAMAKTKGVILPKEVQVAFGNLLQGAALKSASEMDLDHHPAARNFLYAAPPFVEGHLIARGLYRENATPKMEKTIY